MSGKPYISLEFAGTIAELEGFLQGRSSSSDEATVAWRLPGGNRILLLERPLEPVQGEHSDRVIWNVFALDLEPGSIPQGRLEATEVDNYGDDAGFVPQALRYRCDIGLVALGDLRIREWLDEFTRDLLTRFGGFFSVREGPQTLLGRKMPPKPERVEDVAEATPVGVTDEASAESVDTDKQPARSQAVRVPQKPAVLNRWKATWKRVKGQWAQGTPLDEMSAWLKKMYPKLACSPDTLRDIVRAGELGLLED